MVSRHRQPDCILLVKPFVSLPEVENPGLEVVEYPNLHRMEEIGLREVTHDVGYMSNHVEY